MTRTVSPAPYGAPGLEFGNTTEYPYRPGRPHGGQDHQWRYADVARSRQTYAPATGTVTAAYNDGGWHDGWGNYVDIAVPTLDGTNVRARLAHHETGTVQVRVGDHVTAGVTRIGTMGNTGNAPGGIHLHEELWINGRRVDPVYYRTHDIPGTPATAGDESRPFEQSKEDDMTVQQYEDLMWEIACNRPIKLYALVNDKGEGGWIWVGPSGRWWIVPSGEYALLVAAEKLSQPRPVRAIQQNELDFISKQLLGGLVPDSKTDYKAETQLEHILTLDDATVKKLAASIAEVPVTVSEAQLQQIAAAAAKGAEEGGTEGAKAAIKDLSFVVTAE